MVVNTGSYMQGGFFTCKKPPLAASRLAFKVLLDFFQKIAGSRGSEATEVWVPDQTSGTQAPFFGGLLGPTVRSAASAATPPQFARPRNFLKKIE